MNNLNIFNADDCIAENPVNLCAMRASIKIDDLITDYQYAEHFQS